MADVDSRRIQELVPTSPSGCYADLPELGAAIADAAAALGRAERETVHNFALELLSGRYGTEEIENAWSQASAHIFFPRPSDLETVLRLIRDLTKTSPGQDHQA